MPVTHKPANRLLGAFRVLAGICLLAILLPGSIASAAGTTSDADCIFDWAQTTYPALFAPPHGTSQSLAPYYYRYYSTAGAYLGTSADDGHVYYIGPLSGGSLLDLGPQEGWSSRASCPSAGATTTSHCAQIQASTEAYAPGVRVDCSSSDFARISSNGLPSHAMMAGITATNLQVPVPQAFAGTNAWRIPLNPSIAAAPTSVVDGPVGIAVNGVPIFNPCKQGGCQNGDTKALGELDACNGHAGRADDYHYHAAPVCLMAERPANYWDTHPVGWALDGFGIYGFNDADGTTALRDAICGGNTKAVLNGPAGYSYHLTDTPPYIMSCLRGVPSPDLAGQGAKYRPMRQPPVTPFRVSAMTLSTDPDDGYQVLQFSSSIPFRTTETGSDSYANAPGTYRIRYKQVSGAELSALLALGQNAGKSACWNFQFSSSTGAGTQPAISYCR